MGYTVPNTIKTCPWNRAVSHILGIQLKSGPLTKPWIFHVRCYDIILLHVQELARMLEERGESVLAICFSGISRQWVLVFEQHHFLRFHSNKIPVYALNFRKDLWGDLVIAIWISCSIPGVNTDFCRLRFLSKSEPVSRNFLIIFAIELFTSTCLLNFSKNFVYSGRKTSFLNNFPK